MLVDEHQAVRALGHEIPRTGLTDWAQDAGRSAAVCLARCKRRRSVVEYQMGPSGHRLDHRRHITWYRPVAKRIAAVERRSHCALQRREDGALVAKADLLLRRMHVDVDQLRVDLDVDHSHRVPAPLQAALVALLEGVDE